MASDSDSDEEEIRKKLKSTESVPLPKLRIEPTTPGNSAASPVINTPETELATPPSASYRSMASTSATPVTSRVDSNLIRKLMTSDDDGHSKSTNISKKLSPYKIRKTAESDNYRNLLYKLNTILYEIKRLDEKIREIGKQKKEEPLHQDTEELEMSFEYDLPIKNMEELESIELKLKSDRVFFNKLVMRLKTLASTDPRMTIVNFMKTLLANEVALKFSFVGAKTKLSFKVLMLYKVLVAAVRFRYPETLEVTIGETVAKWLVQATLRLSRQMKKSTTDSNTDNMAPC